MLEDLLEQEKREQEKQQAVAVGGDDDDPTTLLSDAEFERLRADVLGTTQTAASPLPGWCTSFQLSVQKCCNYTCYRI